MADSDLLELILPVLLLLGLGVLAAIFSREARLSPIIGYLLLGLGISATGHADAHSEFGVLAELGVVFLLFDIGLHFSLGHVRERARDIFGFGPLQVVFATAGLAVLGFVFGLSVGAALLVGATLALSSTAVVARIIAERHQQNCPVGLTATAILVFQDVAAIFLLIVVQASDGSGGAFTIAAMALAKAAGAFAVAVVLARYVVRPVFALVARTRNEEVFTATALFVALTAAWASGKVGLSLTLGAFLGGMMLSETPYRPVIQSEIKPFRGLMLGFFFITVGASIELKGLIGNLPWVLLGAVLLIAVKSLANAAASLVFRWSIPGSTQLGILLSQGSEFTFVLLSLPPVRALVGEQASEVLIATVALTLALTPTLAEVGRSLAGRLRARRARRDDPELIPQDMAGPVLIVGMDQRGRTVADALNEFEIGYVGVEADPKRLREAIADGYMAVFGDVADPRLWEPVSLAERQVIVLTSPSVAVASEVIPVARQRFPLLRAVAIADTGRDAADLRGLGLIPVLDDPAHSGASLAKAVLAELGTDPEAIDNWSTEERARAAMAPA